MELHAKRPWGWADWFMVGTRFVGFLLSMIHYLRDTPDHRLGLVVSLGILAYAAPQLFYLPGHIRPKLYVAAEFVCSGGFTLYVSTFATENAASYYFIPLLVISFLSSRRTFYAVLAGGVLGFAFLLTRTGGLNAEAFLNLLSNLCLFAAFGFGFGVFLRQKHEQAVMARTIEEKNRELERYIQQMERVTLLEERSRMSRELHDTVGHSLTASIVAMEAVLALVDRDAAAAKARLKEVIVYSRENLERFRRTVREMAMTELKLPLDELLRKTAEEFASQTKIRMVFEAETYSGHMPEAVKLALLRCLQESLTNAMKHGSAKEIRIRLSYGRAGLELIVRDNGVGFDRIENSFGIDGMKERIEALRGSLSVDSKPGQGATVRCAIPLGV